MSIPLIFAIFKEVSRFSKKFYEHLQRFVEISENNFWNFDRKEGMYGQIRPSPGRGSTGAMKTRTTAQVPSPSTRACLRRRPALPGVRCRVERWADCRATESFESFHIRILLKFGQFRKQLHNSSEILKILRLLSHFSTFIQFSSLFGESQEK